MSNNVQRVLFAVVAAVSPTVLSPPPAVPAPFTVQSSEAAQAWDRTKDTTMTVYSAPIRIVVK